MNENDFVVVQKEESKLKLTKDISTQVDSDDLFTSSSSSATNFDFLKLPENILLMILSQLSIRELLTSISLTCKQLNKLIRSQPYLRKLRSFSLLARNIETNSTNSFTISDSLSMGIGLTLPTCMLPATILAKLTGREESFENDDSGSAPSLWDIPIYILGISGATIGTVTGSIMSVPISIVSIPWNLIISTKIGRRFLEVIENKNKTNFETISKKCYLCSRLFTTYWRRHHCRCCLNSFCSKCSSHQVMNARVCDNCFDDLTSIVPEQNNFISIQNNSAEPKIRLVCDFLESWGIAKELLSHKIADFNSLSTIIHQLHSITHTDGIDKKALDEYSKAKTKNLEGLKQAINDFPCFFTTILPFIQRMALNLPEIASLELGNSFSFPLLLNSNYGKTLEASSLTSTNLRNRITISRKLSISILANSFLCNHRDAADQINAEQVPMIEKFNPGEFGCFDWYLVESYPIKVGIERIKCMIEFFYQSSFQFHREEWNGAITFQRISNTLDEKDLENDESLVGERIIIHTNSMEEVSASEFVDFANRDLHIGCIIPSATQEEILFSCRPDLFIGLMFCQRMNDNEAIIISGAPKVINYQGYGNSFRFDGGKLVDVKKTVPQTVIAIDAVMENQYTRENIIRDINKCIVGFSCSKKVETSMISTGKFGCGAFGGDLWLKFLQQIVAAGYNHVGLQFSCYHNVHEAKMLNALLNAIKHKALRVCDLWNILTHFQGPFKVEFFHDYITQSILNLK